MEFPPPWPEDGAYADVLVSRGLADLRGGSGQPEPVASRRDWLPDPLLPVDEDEARPVRRNGTNHKGHEEHEGPPAVPNREEEAYSVAAGKEYASSSLSRTDGEINDIGRRWKDDRGRSLYVATSPHVWQPCVVCPMVPTTYTARSRHFPTATGQSTDRQTGTELPRFGRLSEGLGLRTGRQRQRGFGRITRISKYLKSRSTSEAGQPVTTSAASPERRRQTGPGLVPPWSPPAPTSAAADAPVDRRDGGGRSSTGQA